jgi:hypothetical protein
MCAMTLSRFSGVIGLGRISGVGEKPVGIEEATVPCSRGGCRTVDFSSGICFRFNSDMGSQSRDH